MRLCLITCALLVSACTRNEPEIIFRAPLVPDDLLRPCSGWQGNAPRTDRELAGALVAERAGRKCANTKIETVKEILIADDPKRERPR